MGDGLKRAQQAARAAPQPQPAVQPGQVWADNDPRCEGRTLRVERIDGERALCRILTNGNAVQAEIDRSSPPPRNLWRTQDRRGCTTRISLSRFRPTSTGYRLVQPEGD